MAWWSMRIVLGVLCNSSVQIGNLRIGLPLGLEFHVAGGREMSDHAIELEARLGGQEWVSGSVSICGEVFCRSSKL